MHNYYNIIPSVILDVCIIFLFEGLLFLLYVLPAQQTEIANKLYSQGQDSKALFQKLDAEIQTYNNKLLTGKSNFADTNSNQPMRQEPLPVWLSQPVQQPTTQQKTIQPPIMQQQQQQQLILPTLQQKIKSSIVQALSLLFGIGKNNEKDAFNKGKTNYIIILTFTTLGLILLLLAYFYVIVKILKKTINWKSIFISLFFIILFIIGFEIIYLLFILYKKKINEDKLKLFFINQLTNI